MSAAESSSSKISAPKPSRWPLLVIIVLLLVLAGVGAGWYLSARHTAEAAETVAAPKPLLPPPALYYALEPAFVVNLDTAGFEGPHYLQIEVQLMTRDPRVHEALAQHAPALRAQLLLLFGQQSIADVSDREGKEALQHKALAEVRHLIQVETGSEAVEELLFTSFITQ